MQFDFDFDFALVIAFTIGFVSECNAGFYLNLADDSLQLPHLIMEKKMKRLLLIVAALGAMASNAAFANAELAKQKNCLACHAVDAKLVGPGYKEIAAKYRGDKSAEAKLAKKIREGGKGAWGEIPMPANPQVSEAESVTLAKWVLSLK